MASVEQGNRGAPDDDDDATMPSPISKSARKPDMDDASPPPANHRDFREDDVLLETTASLDHASDENHSPDSLTTRTNSNSTDAESQNDTSSNNTQETSTVVEETTSNETEEEDPEAESIALARMLMEQEAVESYGALSADYLRYNADQFSPEDLAALQAAMAEDEGSEDGAVEQPFTYDVMLRLGESIGDVKKERWRVDAQSQIDKLPEFQFDATKVKGKDENDCDVKCLVCQFPYEEGEKLRRLPCGHSFHSNCAAQWLKDNDICPYCRQTIVGNKNST